MTDPTNYLIQKFSEHYTLNKKIYKTAASVK